MNAPHVDRGNRRSSRWIIAGCVLLMAAIVSPIIINHHQIRRLLLSPKLDIPDAGQVVEARICLFNNEKIGKVEAEIILSRNRFQELYRILSPARFEPDMKANRDLIQQMRFGEVVLKLNDGRERRFTIYDWGHNPVLISENEIDMFWGGDTDHKGQPILAGAGNFYRLYRGPGR